MRLGIQIKGPIVGDTARLRGWDPLSFRPRSSQPVLYTRITWGVFKKKHQDPGPIQDKISISEGSVWYSYFYTL